MNCYNGLREESSMKSFALLTMKSETSFRWNLQPTASDEIKSVKLPTKSDFITKWFHPRKWIYSVRMTDLIEKSTAVAMLFSGGQGWIRTIEVVDGRFTVCSLWPLGNPSVCGADDWSRTNNLMITNQLLCHWATSAFPTINLIRLDGDPKGARTPDLQRDRLAF